MDLDSDYTLDFIIPEGPTGPTGPIGITAILYTNFENATSASYLTLIRTNVVPENFNIFAFTNNTIFLNEIGYYEISFSGRLKETGSTTSSSVIIKTEDNGVEENFITISLDNSQEIYFSQTKILKANSSVRLVIEFNKSSTSNGILENANLIIKKFPY